MKPYVSMKTAKLNMETFALHILQMETVKHTLQLLGKTAFAYSIPLRGTAMSQPIIRAPITVVAELCITIHATVLPATALVARHVIHST